MVTNVLIQTLRWDFEKAKCTAFKKETNAGRTREVSLCKDAAERWENDAVLQACVF